MAPNASLPTLKPNRSALIGIGDRLALELLLGFTGMRTCCPEHDQPPLRHRWPHHPPCRLRNKPAETQAGRGAVRLGQDHRRAGAAHVARRQEARLQVHLDNGRLRSHQTAEIDRSGCLNGRRGTTKAQRRRIRHSNTAHLFYQTPQNAAPRRHFQQPASGPKAGSRRSPAAFRVRQGQTLALLGRKTGFRSARHLIHLSIRLGLQPGASDECPGVVPTWTYKLDKAA